jgi:O-antigen/teichoic acid export membrane protein
MLHPKKLAIQGAIWTLIGYGAGQGLRLVNNLILTHLLVPEMFGLMSLVNTFIMGLALFSDIGIGPSIIQNKRGNDPDFLNTAWTLQILRGFGLWLGCLLIAWPIAQFYQDSRLTWLIPLVGLNTIIGGFNSTARSTLNRQIRLEKIIFFDFGSQVLSLTVMIVWATFSPTIWALVMGNLVGGLLGLVTSYLLIPGYTNRFAWDRESIQEILSFGKWIFVSTAMTFVANQADGIILAKLLSLEILGIYTIALTFSSLPAQVIDRVCSQVLFPLVAQMANLPRENLRAKSLNQRKLMLIGGILTILFLVCFGDLLILKLYDARYAQAAWMLPILALGFWPYLLAATGRQSLMAIGKPNYQAYGQFLKSLHVGIGLPLSFHFFGLPGFVITVALNDIELYGLITYGLWREKLGCFQQDIKATTILFVLLTLMLTVRFMLGFGFPIGQLFSSS